MSISGFVALVLVLLAIALGVWWATEELELLAQTVDLIFGGITIEEAPQ